MHKKYYTGFVLLLCTMGVAAQQTFTRNDAGLQGNAGAQSGFFETVSPVNYPAGANSWWHLLDLRHTNPDNNYAMQLAGSFFDQELWFRKTNNNPAQPWSKILLETNGRVGIGTTAPTEALDVAGNIRANNISLAASTVIASSGRLHITGEEILYLLNKSGVTIGKEWGGTGDLRVQGITTIGSLPATPSGYRLYVESGILTEKIKVALKNSANWADHVFAPGYKLKPLHQVEAFIKVNKHLPGVPSAETLVKEGGVDVNVMLAKQMEKIEELTLHLIKMNKRLEKLDKENSVLRKMIKNKK